LSKEQTSVPQNAWCLLAEAYRGSAWTQTERAMSNPKSMSTLDIILPATLGALIIAPAVLAQAPGSQSQVEEVVVIGQTIDDLNLNSESRTGSRLGLTVMETPATVELIDSSVMRARGYHSVADAVQSLPGVVSGENPAAPSTFSIRGFTRSEIMVLRDGIWLGPTGMVMRPQNTFNLDRIEVLRGPASVLHGQGVVGGTVDTIIRRPTANQPQSFEFVGSYGRYSTYQLGFGAAGALGDSAWYRVDLSQYGSDGFVDRMDPESLNATVSILWQPTEAVDVEFQIDHLDDSLANYWGTPLVPQSFATQPLTGVITTTTGDTIDERMRFVNYNIDDGRAESDQLLLRGDVTWRLSDNVELRNTTYSFDADREWLNAEGYIFCTAIVDVCTQTNVIQRYYGYFFVFHEQELLGNRFTVNFDQELGGRANKFVAGFEITDLDLVRSRGFRISVPQVPGDGVDPFNPVPGSYGPEELRGTSPTAINTRAIFFEDALQITDQLSLVGAVRYDEFDLDRDNFDGSGVFDAGSSFERDFDWVSWRLGAVYQFSDSLVGYGQYSDAKDPANSNIFLVNANENFDLTDAEQWEIGLKTSLLDGRAEATLAYYQIQRDDVLQQIGVDSASNIGGRDSNGVEFSGTLSANDQWRLGANAAFTDAEFKRSTNFVNFAGNTPPNVPEWTANLWTSYSNIAGLPLEIGGSVRYIDDRFGDNANMVMLSNYTLLDLFAAWTGENYRVTARVNNVTDEVFASWSDIFYLGQTDPSFLYANQVMLGSPRTYELSLEISF